MRGLGELWEYSSHRAVWAAGGLVQLRLQLADIPLSQDCTRSTHPQRKPPPPQFLLINTGSSPRREVHYAGKFTTLGTFTTLGSGCEPFVFRSVLLRPMAARETVKLYTGRHRRASERAIPPVHLLHQEGADQEAGAVEAMRAVNTFRGGERREKRLFKKRSGKTRPPRFEFTFILNLRIFTWRSLQ